MRLAAFALAFLVAVPGSAAAQSWPADPIGTIPPLRGPLPTGSIPAIGLPPVGAPLPAIGLPPIQIPAIGGFRNAVRRPIIDTSRFSGTAQSVVGWQGVVLVVPQAAEMAEIPVAREIAPQPERRSSRIPTGVLDLEVRPGSAQVFIDGYYMGTPDDFVRGRGEFSLESGAHSVKVDAPGYEPVSFDVKISPDQTITYRKALTALARAPEPEPVAAVEPKTFYLIPGCYLGDVPPKDAALPASCDLRQTLTFVK